MVARQRDGEEDDEHEREWLWGEALGSRPGYRDMEAFIASLDTRRYVELL